MDGSGIVYRDSQRTQAQGSSWNRLQIATADGVPGLLPRWAHGFGAIRRDVSNHQLNKQCAFREKCAGFANEPGTLCYGASSFFFAGNTLGGGLEVNRHDGDLHHRGTPMHLQDN